MGGIAFDDLVAVRPPSGNNLLVIDALNLSFRWKHRGETDFAEAFVDTVISFAKSYSAEKIIITSDLKGSSYRKNLSSIYKENRKEKYTNQTDLEKEAFKEFLQGFRETISLCKEKWSVLELEGVEADDFAAYICQTVSKDYEHTWLISTDRDWDLLLSDTISRFSYITRKEYTKANWFDHYDVPMDKYIDYKVLMGDSGDNVLGIPQVGPKRACILLEEYGSAFDIYNSIPLLGKAKYIQNVNNSGGLILLNYELMDLVTYCGEAIGQAGKDLVKKET